MSGDTLVYDMSSMSEGTPSIFVKKDWLNILDNQNGNYAGNQSVIDTSQLANSNKYMNYREAYLAVPMILSAQNNGTQAVPLIDPAAAGGGTSADYAFGLKNWFGSIVHSFTLDYNGTTIIQQTPFVNMWNSFKLMTTLSWGDVITSGAHMGFYPDDPLSWGFVDGANGSSTGASLIGVGTCNNANALGQVKVDARFNTYNIGNVGLLRRQQYINYDADAIAGAVTAGGSAYSALLTAASAGTQYKSYVFKRAPASGAAIQYRIMATIHLKHLHSFFQNVPLLKGVFMKMTMTLNQPVVTITATGAGNTYATANATVSVNVPSGGISPIMIASKQTAVAADYVTASGAASATTFTLAGPTANTLTVHMAVGSKPIATGAFTALPDSGLNPSIQLYVPAYTFNGPFESAYLANPVKKIAYTDIYQYQVSSVPAGQPFNQLITNGIANIKSVLILPFFTQAMNAGLQPFQSPFDPAGAGPTSPLCLLTNFNVVVAGQNMIYNTQRYSYEQFLNQLYGANAVNAGETDGLTSALFDKLGFEMEYCYYYVNCSRMLPVEEAVPKSVSIIGQNNSAKDIQMLVFVEYGVEVSVDVLSGARV